MRKVAERRFSGAVLATFLLCLAHCTSAAEVPTDPQKLRDAIKQLVEQQKGNAQELDATMKALNELLQDYGRNNAHKYVVLTGDSIATIIETGQFDPKHADIATKLAKILKGLNARTPPPPNPMVDVMTDLVGKIKAATEVQKNHTDLPAKLKELSEALLLLENAMPNAAAARKATELRALITGKPQATFDPETVEALRKLRDEIEKLVNAARDKIYVISAQYGDLRPGSIRTCDARQHVEHSCQGINQCSPWGNAEVLCGYDPAKFTEPKHKQLVVDYACIGHDQDEWVKRNFKKSKIRTAKLRTNATIYCER